MSKLDSMELFVSLADHGRYGARRHDELQGSKRGPGKSGPNSGNSKCDQRLRRIPNKPSKAEPSNQITPGTGTGATTTCKP